MASDKPSLLDKLPTELIDMISGGNDGTMSRVEAEAYRLELMDERTVFVGESDSEYFGQLVNLLCVLLFLCRSLPDVMAKIFNLS